MSRTELSCLSCTDMCAPCSLRNLTDSNFPAMAARSNAVRLCSSLSSMLAPDRKAYFITSRASCSAAVINRVSPLTSIVAADSPTCWRKEVTTDTLSSLMADCKTWWQGQGRRSIAACRRDSPSILLRDRSRHRNSPQVLKATLKASSPASPMLLSWMITAVTRSACVNPPAMQQTSLSSIEFSLRATTLTPWTSSLSSSALTCKPLARRKETRGSAISSRRLP
mmetsp:Transcript_26934/g.88078  ORF Transcript_26934/g.88078 Transcript_26934/m.88078 type:complete len:224 (-) Transcript_26934:803-1474(-)